MKMNVTDLFKPITDVIILDKQDLDLEDDTFIYLLTHGLFNDTVSGSDNTVSKD